MPQSLPIIYNWYQFQDLDTKQLYELLKLRQDVFIIEQKCIYADMDQLDFKCLHLLGYEGNNLVAYLRLMPAEFHSSGNIAFGRIIAVSNKRGSGLGKSLLQQAMCYVAETHPQQRIQLAAQCYLQGFYEKFDFEAMSEPYDEDGIPHIDMLYQQSKVD